MQSALYAIARPSVRLSVCLSHGCIIEQLKLGLWKFSLYGSPIPLVFAGQVSSRNSKRFHPNGGVKQGWGGKISHFIASSVNILKTVADTAEVTIND